jgi:hypothetical protein
MNRPDAPFKGPVYHWPPGPDHRSGADPNDRGCWPATADEIVALSGDTFSFGDAGIFGSRSSMHLSSPTFAISETPSLTMSGAP